MGGWVERESIRDLGKSIDYLLILYLSGQAEISVRMSLSLSLHARTHACTHARTHARTHTHTHTNHHHYHHHQQQQQTNKQTNRKITTTTKNLTAQHKAAGQQQSSKSGQLKPEFHCWSVDRKYRPLHKMLSRPRHPLSSARFVCLSLR